MGRTSSSCAKAILSARSTAVRAATPDARAYSAERLFALDEYCNSTSPWRVLLVLLLYCLPALSSMLFLDMTPLQDPGEGWSANTGFWIRRSISCSVTSWTLLLEAQLVVPGMKLTAARNVAIAVAVGTAHTGALVALASHWAFPIPFTTVVSSLSFGMVQNLVVVASLGSGDRELLRRYSTFAKCLWLQASMLIVYPAYNAIFLSLKGVPQLAFVLLLPVIKIGFKYLISMQKIEDDDLIPGLHASVDIFDALYMTKCMQSAGTLAVGFGIIAVDVVQNYVAIRFLAKQTRSLLAVSGSTSPMNLLSQVMNQLWKSQQLDASIQNLRFGSRKFSVSAQAEAELARLRSIQARKNSSQATVLQRRRSKTSTAILPAVPDADSKADFSQPLEKSASTEADFVRETTSLLHECEAVVVVEYVEAVVPVLYAIYLSILFHLPNAKYYQDIQGMTDEKMLRLVMNILIYAALELLSLVYVARMVKRSFDVSVFYQLAFALESDWRIYQCNFVVWILVIFQLLLVHNGCDFTFKFAWVHDQE